MTFIYCFLSSCFSFFRLVTFKVRIPDKAAPVVSRGYLVSGVGCCLFLVFSFFSDSCAAAEKCPDAHWTGPSPVEKKRMAEYKNFHCTSRYLTMPDGVKIAVDLYLPEGLEPGQLLPTLLRMTRYGRSFSLHPPYSWFWKGKPYAPDLIRETPHFFVENGYAWVEVDVRGAGASFGYRPFPFSPKEIHDGASIVDWVIQQPWSNGRVGALGTSYGGIAAEMLLVNKHPAVKAVAPSFAAYDLYADQAYPGGVHLIWLTDTWGRLNEAMDKNVPGKFFGWELNLYVKGVRPVDEDRDKRLLRAAIDEHDKNFDIHFNTRVINFRDDPVPNYPDKTMDSFSPHAYIEEIRASGAAIYSYSGWYDGAGAQSAISRYQASGKDGHRLTIGPWAHGGWLNHSPFAKGERSCFKRHEELLRFFDYHLKGIDNGFSDEAPVHYYTMGEEGWKAAQAWPPSSLETVSFYLAGDNLLSRKQPDDKNGYDQYLMVKTVGSGTYTRWKILMGKKYYTLYPNRNKEDKQLLCYTSPPLKKGMEVTGAPLVTLFVSTSSADGIFFVYLEDVDERGHVTYITEGVLRALHRKGNHEGHADIMTAGQHTFKHKNAMPLAPGEIAELTFSLLPISYFFKAGHSIRLAIAGADKDHFSPLPGDPPEVRFYRKRTSFSRIDLPTVSDRQE